MDNSAIASRASCGYTAWNGAPRSILVDSTLQAYDTVPVHEVCTDSREGSPASPMIVPPSEEVVAAASSLLDWQAQHGFVAPEEADAGPSPWGAAAHAGTDGRRAQGRKVLSYDPAIGKNGAFYFVDVADTGQGDTAVAHSRPPGATLHRGSAQRLLDRSAQPHRQAVPVSPCSSTTTDTTVTPPQARQADAMATALAAHPLGTPNSSMSYMANVLDEVARQQHWGMQASPGAAMAGALARKRLSMRLMQVASMEALLAANLYEENDVLSVIYEQEGQEIMAGQPGHTAVTVTYHTVTPAHAVDTSPIDLRPTGSLEHLAQTQYNRQLKTLQALRRQAELTAEENMAALERERRREHKYAQIDQERQAQEDQRAENAARAAETRAARYEAAVRHEQAMRAAAAAKSRFMSDRAGNATLQQQRVAAAEARREATYRNNLALLEARRQVLLARERKLEDILRQREELRQLQLQIKAEEDALKELQRRAIRHRAEEDLQGRVAQFHARNVAKDEQTVRRREANEAAAVAEAERQALAARLSDKTSRGEALAAQRQALLLDMQDLRQQMQRQARTGEEVVRASLQRMRQRGSTALPPEVARSLEGLQAGGPVRATALMGNGRGVALLEGLPPQTPRAAFGGSPAVAPMTPRSAAKAAGARGAAGRRPKSAASSPRSPRIPAAGGGHSYLTAMISPRVGQPGKTSRMGAAAGAMRPGSASADSRRRPQTSPPVTPTRTTTAPVTIPGPSPYGPYTFPLPPKPRVPPPSVEEQVRAATDTSEAARAAVVSGRYTGVHEVARPGSRREEELRAVLKEEVAKEGERQALLAKVTDDAERSRLIKYFTMEREEAKRRILALSNAAQAALYP
ncbi:hypothetical protein GPECTOR_5g92 [Gonium pectorale]|uniref:Uncharacterized protein n=1 Tax=Gonium pectorale TaxID=33097 RepID=A0A150GYN7_GONPE|nr:hypothetical protein GPECTOR_5g92 [Gonium pectorale]|eukprot:KXZ54440.1 hypothetical protein GPECTOR_5g92 [Gonium pectorale]